MARVTKKITVCDRDALGREKPATAKRTLSVEGISYTLRLCEEHARMFDREMFAWTRLGEELAAVTPMFGSKYAEDARKAATLRARQQPVHSHHEAQESAPQIPAPSISHRPHRLGQPLSAEQVKPGERYSNGWLLTPHAAERAEQRRYSIDEVLTAAARPEITYDDQAAGGVIRRIHQAGGCAVAVNTQEKVVLTVLHRDEAKYALDHHNHLSERVAR